MTDVSDRIQRDWGEHERLYPKAQFWDTRRGYGRHVTAGRGTDAQTVWVTNTLDSGPGSLRAALTVTGNTHVKFAVTGDIVDPARRGYTVASDTLIDGTGYPGTIYGAIHASDATNVIVMYLSVTQPFAWGKNPSGPCIGGSNASGLYVWRCTVWDSGDVLFTSGAYYPTANPPPYSFTLDSCRVGPNPGEYAVMSPILGDHPGITPGALNGINNDARNGKGAETAYDHNAVDAGQPFSAFDHVVQGTMVGNVIQGCIMRNGKARSQTVDLVGNLIAKYGAPCNLGDSVNNGGGSVAMDNATMNIEGNVYIPYAVGEEFLGFRDEVAAANGMPPIHVTSPALDPLNLDGTGKRDANVYVSPTNWVPPGGAFPKIPATTGFARPYPYTVADVSGQTAAETLVHQLEDDPATRAGNPFSTTQPPSWRLVHTGTAFPVPG